MRSRRPNGTRSFSQRAVRIVKDLQLRQRRVSVTERDLGCAEAEVIVSVAPTPRSWELHAACRGTKSVLFVPPVRHESSEQQRIRESAATQICGQCPVRRECLEYALRVDEPFGVWGGLNEKERRQLSLATQD